MTRLVVAALVAAVAIGVALLLQRRRPDPPTQGATAVVPVQVDRHDFAGRDADWLVVAFTSAVCETCASVVARASLLASEDVVVQEVEVRADPELHRRYGIDAVPLVLVADGEGVVRRHFLGPVSGTDLWGAVAELRQPGTLGPDCQPGNAAA